jgi:hypothetical protein
MKEEKVMGLLGFPRDSMMTLGEWNTWMLVFSRELCVWSKQFPG